MTDRFTSPLDEFTQHAMLIAHNRQRTIAQQRQDFENLVAAIDADSRERLLLVLHERGIIPKDLDLLRP